MTTYHMCIDVAGALINNDVELLSSFQDDNGKFMSVRGARRFLVEELKKGHERIPCGECDNFDFSKGCLGHDD